MNIIKILLFLSLMAVFTSGCTSSGSGNNDDDNTTQSPTPTNIPFQLFSDSYFNQGYLESWGSIEFFDSLIGRQSNVGNLFVETDATLLFNGQIAIPVDQNWSYINTATNAQNSISDSFYYSNFTTDRRLIGFENNVNGVVYLSTSTTAIPLVGTIGNSGDIGNYSGSNDTNVTATWELRDGFNSYAYLDISLAYYDSDGVLIKRRTFTSRIDDTGTSIFFQLQETSFGHTTVLFTSDRQS